MITKIDVSIVYAEKHEQRLFETRVPRGTNALELFEIAEFGQSIEALKDLDVADLEFAVYAQPIRHDHLLEAGDRVEIIRPLTADPKVVRRELAKLGKTMGGKDR